MLHETRQKLDKSRVNCKRLQQEKDEALLKSEQAEHALKACKVCKSMISILC